MAGTAFFVPWASGLTTRAIAMGGKTYPQGMRKIQGYVKINGIPASIGDLVTAGDMITTGPQSLAIFVLGTDVYQVRENTRLQIDSEAKDEFKEKIIDVLKLLDGKIMAVFRRKRKRLITRTAVIGIRGTGFYVESDPERTYFCTCYGVSTIQAKTALEVREKVWTRHHEAPRYVYPSGHKDLIVRAPVINHTDAELIMLESMVGRRPPFEESTGYQY